MKSQLILVYLIFLVNGYEHIWYTFKNRHRIVFHSEDEERRRYNIFKKNLERIENHNRRYKDGQFAWYEDLNKFAVFNEDEFRETYLMHQVHKFSKNFTLHINERANIPQHIDWREKQLVTPVKNQGACGSCWSFSAVGALESLYARKYNKLISLSEQSLIDCSSSADYETDGCNSGIVQGALEYVQDHGIATEDRYKYLGYKQNSCHKFEAFFKISGYKNIAYKDEKDLKNAVSSIGPVSVSLNGDLLQRYAGGIIDGNCSDKINHAAVVVGYGRENGQEYWILKNSWGVNWGENGYFRLGMGNNLCSVATQACYPYL